MKSNHISRTGRLLWKIRINREETIRHVAEKAGVSTAMISLIENGKKRGNNFVIEKLCQYYGVPVEVLMFRSMKLSEMEFNKKKAFKSVQRNLNQIIDEVFDLKNLDQE